MLRRSEFQNGKNTPLSLFLQKSAQAEERKRVERYSLCSRGQKSVGVIENKGREICALSKSEGESEQRKAGTRDGTGWP
jgi:hypothetical protein